MTGNVGVESHRYLLGTYLPAVHELKKAERPADAGLSGGSGGGIRTRDLRVMSPTSYLAAPPRGGHLS